MCARGLEMSDRAFCGGIYTMLEAVRLSVQADGSARGDLRVDR